MQWGQVRSAEGWTAALTVPDEHKTTSCDKRGGAAPRQEVFTRFLVDSAAVLNHVSTECFLPQQHKSSTQFISDCLLGCFIMPSQPQI